MSVTPWTRMHVDVKEKFRCYVAPRETRLLERLTYRRLGRTLASVNVSPGLHPDPETPVEVQHDPAR